MVKTVVLVSGGVDSTITYFLLKHQRPNDDIIPVFVNLRQSYWEKELIACQNLFKDLRCLETNTPTNDDKENSFIPNRNLFLASYVTLAEYPDVIYICGIAGEGRPDKSPEIFEGMSDLISRTSDKKITVTSDLWEYGKTEAVKMFLESGVPDAREIMLKTVSCYSNEGDGQCNDCDACFRRWLSLTANGIECQRVSNEMIETYVQLARGNKVNQQRLEDMRKVGLLA